MTSQIAAMQQAEAEAGLKSPGLGTGNARLQAKYPQSHQGVSADAIASQEGISREALDAFGAESQRRAAHAIQNGYFDRSIVPRSEEHTSELQSLMRISYAVFCLKKKKQKHTTHTNI